MRDTKINLSCGEYVLRTVANRTSPGPASAMSFSVWTGVWS
jgi:hypothetical protein